MKYIIICLAILLAFLPSLILSCSCWPGAFTAERNESIRNAFCYTEDVFLGTVMAVTCTCWLEEDGGYCQRYSVTEDGSPVVAEETLTVGVYGDECTRRYFIRDCTDVATDVTPGRSEVIKLDRSLILCMCVFYSLKHMREETRTNDPCPITFM